MRKSVSGIFGPFTPVPDALVTVLGGTNTLVLMAVWRYQQGKDGFCWASLASIAKRAGCARNTARRALCELETRGLMVAAQVAGKTTTRQVNETAMLALMDAPDDDVEEIEY